MVVTIIFSVSESFLWPINATHSDFDLLTAPGMDSERRFAVGLLVEGISVLVSILLGLARGYGRYAGVGAE